MLLFVPADISNLDPTILRGFRVVRVERSLFAVACRLDLSLGDAQPLHEIALCRGGSPQRKLQVVCRVPCAVRVAGQLESPRAQAGAFQRLPKLVQLRLGLWRQLVGVVLKVHGQDDARVESSRAKRTHDLVGACHLGRYVCRGDRQRQQKKCHSQVHASSPERQLPETDVVGAENQLVERRRRHESRCL